MTKKNNSSKRKSRNRVQSGTSIMDPEVFSLTDTAAATNAVGPEDYPQSVSSTSHTSADSLADLDRDGCTETIKEAKDAVSGLDQARRVNNNKNNHGNFWLWITSSSPMNVDDNTLSGQHKRLLKEEEMQGKDGVMTDIEKKRIMNSCEQQRLQQHEQRKSSSSVLQRWDWVALSTLTVAIVAIRLWRIDSPDEVTMDEVHMGKFVNGYLTREFIYDNDPPLGKLLLAGISKLAATNYTGSFLFDQVCEYGVNGEPSTDGFGWCAFVLYCIVDHVLDNVFEAVCKASITWMKTIHNCMVGMADDDGSGGGWCHGYETEWSSDSAHDRDTSQLEYMQSGQQLIRQSPLLLLPLGVYLSLFHLHFHLQSRQPAYLQSAQAEYDLNIISHSFRHGLVSPYIEDQQADPVWSDIVFGSVVQLQTETRPAVYMHSFQKMWEDTNMGKEIKIPGRSKDRRQRQQVAGYEYPDLNTHWIVIRANVSRHSVSRASKHNANTDTDSDEDKDMSDDDEIDDGGEIPIRLQYLKHGDMIRLRHVSTRRCLHSQQDIRSVGRAMDERHSEVSASGEATTSDNADDDNHGDDDDDRDWWVVEVVEGNGPAWLRTLLSPFKGSEKDTYDTMRIASVKALETAFRLRHYRQGCYLHATEDLLPAGTDGGEGRRELSCLKVQQQEGQDRNVVLPESTIWRITLNDHDYLPMDTELAAYPRLSFWQKVLELHKHMWTRSRAFEASDKTNPTSVSASDNTPPPQLWPLALSKSIVTLWKVTGDVDDKDQGMRDQEVQQISVVTNPIVWWTGSFGLLVFVGAQLVITLRFTFGFKNSDRTLGNPA
ncbi:hypothetical protein BGZ51_005903 [Haplosporangium sp. Z 767]|nr:hypothetical protein BGZ51_005903 [Haplosporangium sp. Z 767]